MIVLPDKQPRHPLPPQPVMKNGNGNSNSAGRRRGQAGPGTESKSKPSNIGLLASLARCCVSGGGAGGRSECIVVSDDEYDEEYTGGNRSQSSRSSPSAVTPEKKQQQQQQQRHTAAVAKDFYEELEVALAQADEAKRNIRIDPSFLKSVNEEDSTFEDLDITTASAAADSTATATATETVVVSANKERPDSRVGIVYTRRDKRSSKNKVVPPVTIISCVLPDSIFFDKTRVGGKDGGTSWLKGATVLAVNGTAVDNPRHAAELTTKAEQEVTLTVMRLVVYDEKKKKKADTNEATATTKTNEESKEEEEAKKKTNTTMKEDRRMQRERLLAKKLEYRAPPDDDEVTGGGKGGGGAAATDGTEYEAGMTSKNYPALQKDVAQKREQEEEAGDAAAASARSAIAKDAIMGESGTTAGNVEKQRRLLRGTLFSDPVAETDDEASRISRVESFMSRTGSRTPLLGSHNKGGAATTTTTDGNTTKRTTMGTTIPSVTSPSLVTHMTPRGRRSVPPHRMLCSHAWEEEESPMAEDAKVGTAVEPTGGAQGAKVENDMKDSDKDDGPKKAKGNDIKDVPPEEEEDKGASRQAQASSAKEIGIKLSKMSLRRALGLKKAPKAESLAASTPAGEADERGSDKVATTMKPVSAEEIMNDLDSLNSKSNDESSGKEEGEREAKNPGALLANSSSSGDETEEEKEKNEPSPKGGEGGGWQRFEGLSLATERVTSYVVNSIVSGMSHDLRNDAGTTVDEEEVVMSPFPPGETEEEEEDKEDASGKGDKGADFECDDAEEGAEQQAVEAELEEDARGAEGGECPATKKSFLKRAFEKTRSKRSGGSATTKGRRGGGSSVTLLAGDAYQEVAKEECCVDAAAHSGKEEEEVAATAEVTKVGNEEVNDRSGQTHQCDDPVRDEGAAIGKTRAKKKSILKFNKSRGRMLMKKQPHNDEENETADTEQDDAVLEPAVRKQEEEECVAILPDLISLSELTDKDAVAKRMEAAAFSADQADNDDGEEDEKEYVMTDEVAATGSNPDAHDMIRQAENEPAETTWAEEDKPEEEIIEGGNKAEKKSSRSFLRRFKKPKKLSAKKQQHQELEETMLTEADTVVEVEASAEENSIDEGENDNKRVRGDDEVVQQEDGTIAKYHPDDIDVVENEDYSSFDYALDVTLTGDVEVLSAPLSQQGGGPFDCTVSPISSPVGSPSSSPLAARESACPDNHAAASSDRGDGFPSTVPTAERAATLPATPPKVRSSGTTRMRSLPPTPQTPTKACEGDYDVMPTFGPERSDDASALGLRGAVDGSLSFECRLGKSSAVNVRMEVGPCHSGDDATKSGARRAGRTDLKMQQPPQLRPPPPVNRKLDFDADNFCDPLCKASFQSRQAVDERSIGKRTTSWTGADGGCQTDGAGY